MPHPLPSTVWLILLPKPGDSRGTLQQEQQMVYGTDTIRTDTARMKLRSACLSLLCTRLDTDQVSQLGIQIRSLAVWRVVERLITAVHRTPCTGLSACVHLLCHCKGTESRYSRTSCLMYAVQRGTALPTTESETNSTTMSSSLVSPRPTPISNDLHHEWPKLGLQR